MEPPKSFSRRGVALYHEGKFDEGIAGIETAPRNSDIHSNLGLWG